MTDDLMLSQEEIDALLNQPKDDVPEEQTEDIRTSEVSGTPERLIETKVNEPELEYLTPEEKDALGEIGNISMGTASTTLSELLQQRVTITSPRVRVARQKDLFSAFEVPYMVIQVEFKEGLEGYNILIMQVSDVMIMANLMMGGDGSNVGDEFSEMEISAASEAMNQMIGTASTSLATMFNRNVNISPPVSQLLEAVDQHSFQLPTEDPIVVTSFRLTIGELVDTEMMQIMSVHTAKDEAALLWQGLGDNNDSNMPEESKEPALNQPEQKDNKQMPLETQAQEEVNGDLLQPTGLSSVSANNDPKVEIDKERLAMLMDLPLKVTVVLGRTKKPIKEVLTYTPGAIVEMASQVEEPVEIMVNDVLVARGEVVVVNENFGVRVTDILTPAERVAKITKSG